MPYSALPQSEEQRKERQGNKEEKKKYSRLFCFIKCSESNSTLFLQSESEELARTEQSHAGFMLLILPLRCAVRRMYGDEIVDGKFYHQATLCRPE